MIQSIADAIGVSVDDCKLFDPKYATYPSFDDEVKCVLSYQHGTHSNEFNGIRATVHDIPLLTNCTGRIEAQENHTNIHVVLDRYINTDNYKSLWSNNELFHANKMFSKCNYTLDVDDELLSLLDNSDIVFNKGLKCYDYEKIQGHFLVGNINRVNHIIDNFIKTNGNIGCVADLIIINVPCCEENTLYKVLGFEINLNMRNTDTSKVCKFLKLMALLSNETLVDDGIDDDVYSKYQDILYEIF